MLKKSLGSIVLVALLCSFNTQANVNVEVIENQENSIFCAGIIEIIQIERNNITLNVNETSTTLVLVNSSNSKVYEAPVETTGVWIIDTSNFPVGLYKLQATANSQLQTEDIVLE